MQDFEALLEEYTARADSIICSFLPEISGRQSYLVEAMDYAVRGGGKRIRPLLMESAYMLVSGRPDADILRAAVRRVPPAHEPLTRHKVAGEIPHAAQPAEGMPRDLYCILGPFMAAIEMMHSASLIHDDLPCMDNDTLRRGKASTWSKYGEDMGVLAGDALMIYTFETAMKSQAEPERKLKAIDILAQKSGICGMTGGQSVDVELTGKAMTADELIFINETKTAALIEASLMIGGVLAGGDESVIKRLEEAGRCIGLAFQIEDDILDITGTEEELGKPVGSDSNQDKRTWPTIYGLEQARADAAEYTERALSIVSGIGDYQFLMELIKYLLGRRS